MINLVITFVFFFVGLLLHIFLFRTKILSLNLFSVIVLFFINGLCLIYASIHVCSIFRNVCDHPESFTGIPLFYSSICIYVLLSIWYVGECTVIQHESPSMTILRTLLNAKDHKITKEHLRGLFSNEVLILSRLEDLVTHGHVRFDGNRYFLTPKGSLIAKTIMSHRKLLNRELGG